MLRTHPHLARSVRRGTAHICIMTRSASACWPVCCPPQPSPREQGPRFQLPDAGEQRKHYLSIGASCRGQTPLNGMQSLCMCHTSRCIATAVRSHDPPTTGRPCHRTGHPHSGRSETGNRQPVGPCPRRLAGPLHHHYQGQSCERRCGDDVTLDQLGRLVVHHRVAVGERSVGIITGRAHDPPSPSPPQALADCDLAAALGPWTVGERARCCGWAGGIVGVGVLAGRRPGSVTRAADELIGNKAGQRPVAREISAVLVSAVARIAEPLRGARGAVWARPRSPTYRTPSALPQRPC